MIPSRKAWSLEVISEQVARGRFHSVLLDFDGTISLIREGWQQIMKPYFHEVLAATPRAEDAKGIAACVDDFVDILTGKQTIYQCIQLADEVAARGGTPEDPFAYKDEYQRRLMMRIQHRLDGLEDGSLDPADLVVPGSFALLQGLRDRGATLYIASGTDEEYVLREAGLLGVVPYCNGGIYGARKEYELFSKKMVVESILRTHGLKGEELLGFGDGYVEIENVKEVGGFACGVASDEERRCGVDEWKRNRLIQAGADIIVPDYAETGKLLDYLFPER
jgi:phosphoglycolate phosphatase-like HAD superfamily hydrolase